MPSSIDVTKFEQLKASGDLPSPKGVALAVINLIQRDDTSMAELARVIKADPAFVGRLIKAANGMLNHSRRAVASVPEALMVLGLPAVRTMALGFSLLSSYRDGACRNFNYQHYWSGCLISALAMQAITYRTRAAAAEEAFSLGLLARVGELALATLYPEEYSQILGGRGEVRDVPLTSLERRSFALDHRGLTAAMLNDWGMPRIFCRCALAFEDPDHCGSEEGAREYIMIQSLAMAGRIAEICLAQEGERPTLIGRLFQIADRLKFDRDTVISLCDQVAKEWLSWAGEFQLEAKDLPSFAEMAGSGKDGRRPPTPLENLRGMAAVQTPPTARSTAPGTAQSLRVLVVDDDASMRALVRAVLEEAGHQVFEAENGRQGLEKALDVQPQLMILDWIMPEMDGMELTRALRMTRVGRSIYILILTSIENDDRLVEAFECGVDDFMGKPINPRVLTARLLAGQRVIRLQQEIDRDREENRRIAAELAVVNRRLQEAALTDSLTGFPNRRYAMERIQQEWSAAVRAGRPLACMLIDVDNFKQINDTYGHDVGDAVLREVSQALKNGLRIQDVVARTGGDEFLVICPDTGLEAAAACAERVNQCVSTLVIKVSMLQLHASISIGVACRDDTMPDPSALIKRADQGMYLAKQRGRDTVACVQR